MMMHMIELTERTMEALTHTMTPLGCLQQDGTRGCLPAAATGARQTILLFTQIFACDEGMPNRR